RVLEDVFEQIVDAVEPGGGDVNAGLDDEQRAALEEVTRLGFPPRAWFAHERVALSYTGVFAAIFGILATGDPTYFADFWTQPGYLGADPPKSLEVARLHRRPPPPGARGRPHPDRGHGCRDRHHRRGAGARSAGGDRGRHPRFRA